MPEGKDVMVSSKALVRTVSSVLAGTLACVSGAQGAPNSGLDLTQPILQGGYSYQSTYFYPGVSGDTRAFTATLPLSFGQFKIAFPFSQVRHVLPSHVSTSGKGDLTLSYNYVLPVRSQRFRQTFGVAYESPSGLRFSSREQQIGPLYEFAYRLNDAASLLVLAESQLATTLQQIRLATTSLRSAQECCLRCGRIPMQPSFQNTTATPEIEAMQHMTRLWMSGVSSRASTSWHIMACRSEHIRTSTCTGPHTA